MSKDIQTDALERWQYCIFRYVLFAIFLYMMYELLNHHTHIGDLVIKVVKQWLS
jgi:hypothetical protein